MAGIVGYLIYIDGREPMMDTAGPKVFKTDTEAEEAKTKHPLGMVSVVVPVTAKRLSKLRNRK